MARKIQVLLTCDLHEAETPAVRTVTFGYDGHDYSLELCESHLEEFGLLMGRFTGVARRGAAGVGRTRSATRRSAADSSAVRDWARKHGYAISDRGRISGEVRAAYERSLAARS